MATTKTTTKRGQAAKAPTAAPVTKPTADKAQGLKVVPKRPGFRRAGYAFDNPEGDVIPLADLDDQQYEALTTEPALVTHLVDLPAEGASQAQD
ncbi:hypothetical protein LJR118_002869 [Acidovorax sp. LjRoot118]|uniref:hypothetical protein n=1 Tax=Acidovorax sp. LjRoot118 TaxID=3342256 RepID=UPI003ECF364A